MQSGVIININSKGFGFIKPNGEKENIFFHASKLFNVQFDEIAIGDHVHFNTELTAKGIVAVDVTVI